MIERFEHFTYATNEIMRFWRKLAGEEMEKHGLKGSHAIYFTLLAKHRETGMTAAQICEDCGRDKADVSRMMAILEQKGLLVKEGCHQNLYNGVFKLTDRGWQLAETVMERAGKAVELAGRGLSEESREVFYRALDTIVENMRELSEKGIPEA